MPGQNKGKIKMVQSEKVCHKVKAEVFRNGDDTILTNTQPPQKDRFALFLDYDSFISQATQLSTCLNIKELISFLKDFDQYHQRSLHSAYVYIAINPHFPHARDKEIGDLEACGLIIRKVVGTNYGPYFIADPTIEMTCDIYRCAYTEGVGTITLISNSERLSPIVTNLRESGIITEVVFFKSGIKGELARLADGFINLESRLGDGPSKSIESSSCLSDNQCK
ncbi:MAG: NYN domain-containing protein [Bacilli bacterium]|jgi:hypothetical protein|nr:NYN domain-containing protein [Bacilli bacterium]